MPRWKQTTLAGWGRLPRAETWAARPERTREALAALAVADARGHIAYGAGRSYGDAALNGGGRTIVTSRLDRFSDFDPATGAVTCEPGVTFAELMRVFLPRRWLAPVNPGTAFATIGGAVANDVHGKNHDIAGSFGDHVEWLDLALPSGEVVRCGPGERPELFAATVGGIGLTGLILAVRLRLAKVPSNAVELRERRIASLDEFLAAYAEPSTRDGWSVGWIDVLARGGAMGRGILETARPSTTGVDPAAPKQRAVPVDFPAIALNPLSVRAFNALYWRRVPAEGRERRVAWEKFLFPLDAIHQWNRIYGKRGFRQFQCVVPWDEGARAMPRLLDEVGRAGSASFLAVLKTLGGEGRGDLSFPMKGWTLALDFPERPATLELFTRLERLTLDHGGRLYLAKDSALSAAGFKTMYPRLDRLRAVLAVVDPERRMQSDMARRLDVWGAE